MLQPTPAFPPAPPLAPPAVAGEQLARRYGDGESAVHALREVSLDVTAGQFTAVMGPSGSGKSTLMHVLAGLTARTAEPCASAARTSPRWATRSSRCCGVAGSASSSSVQPAARPERGGERAAAAAHRRPQPGGRLGRHGVRAHRALRSSHAQAVRAVRRPAAARRDRPRPGGRADGAVADEPTGNLDSTAGADVLALLRTAVDEEGQTTVMALVAVAVVAGVVAAVLPARRAARLNPLAALAYE